MVGDDSGDIYIDADADVNFKFLKDTLQVAAKGFLYRTTPSFYYYHYHSRHAWWDHEDLEKTTNLRIEGLLTYPKTRTTLRVAMDELKNYTYLGHAYDLVENEGKLEAADLSLVANTEFKVVKVASQEGADDVWTWLGAESDGNFWLTDEWLGNEIQLHADDDLASYQNLQIIHTGTYNFSFDAETLKLVVTGEYAPEGYTLKGSFDDWGAGVAFVKADDGTFKVSQAIEANGEFKVVNQDGVWFGGEGDSESGDLYLFHAGWRDAELLEGAGVNFTIATAGTYTFTITSNNEGKSLNVEGFDYITLAEALEGAVGTIEDALYTSKVIDNHAYVTDGHGNWVRLDLEDATGIIAGTIFAEKSVNGVLSGQGTAPAIAVANYVIAEGENVPDIAEIDLAYHIDEMPVASQVVTIKTAYYNVIDGVPYLTAFSGYNGSVGQRIALDTDFVGSDVFTEGAEYRDLVIAIELVEPWETESAGAPRRVKASDRNALSNIIAQVIDPDVTPTAINELVADKDVVGVQYINAAGQISAEPFEGINIVVTTYVDGSRSAVKVIK